MGTTITAGLRPEHLCLGPPAEPGPGLALEARSTMVEAMGNVVYEYFDAGGDLRLTLERRDLRAEPAGRAAVLYLPAALMHFFGPDGHRIDTA